MKEMIHWAHVNHTLSQISTTIVSKQVLESLHEEGIQPRQLAALDAGETLVEWATRNKLPETTLEIVRSTSKIIGEHLNSGTKKYLSQCIVDSVRGIVN